MIGEILDLQRVTGAIELPSRAGKLHAKLHELGAVREEESVEDGWRMQVDMSLADAARLHDQPDGDVLHALLPPVEADHDIH